MSLERVSVRSILVVVCLALLGAAMLPGAAVAAPDAVGPAGKAREYIVTLAVTDSDRVIRPSSRSARQRIERRSKRAATAARALARAVGFETRHRYGHAVTGFSAKLTGEQAAELSRDAAVTSIRPARRARLAGQITPTGVQRVKAATDGEPSPNLGTVNVAVIDTGIAPFDPDELNVAEQIDCVGDDDGNTPKVEDQVDYNGHGTHVAGIIGARDNDIGSVGVAPGVRLWSVRAWGKSNYSSEANILCALTWAIDTHSNPTPDIDVINMSFEVPRIDYVEDCPRVIANPDSDAIHKLACNAHELGITMVAAAGNYRTDANSVAPGGYDQVISVGALTDFDGEGSGKAGTGSCWNFGPADDDTYASFSNRGNEVDIIAPGVCVESTSRSASNGGTRLLSGTSQAAPHVTGAVARYLADHPGTLPERMRKLIRASGRLDWDARSDPRWYGVNDPDDPNRVLDVKALTGEAMVKAWVFHDSFKMSGGDTKRTTRVDVQRGGAYNDSVDLAVTGLPNSIAATFGPASLSGLGGLASKLTLRLKQGGDDGIFDLGVRANGSGVSAFSRPLELTVDRRGPVIADLAPRIKGGFATLTRKGGARTVLQWDVSDEVSGVKSSWLQRKTGKKPWRKAGKHNGSSSRVMVKPGQVNKFRVKAKDRSGNKSTSSVLKANLVVLDTASTRLAQPASGGWKTKRAKKAFGGSLIIASTATDSVTSSFNGVAAAVVASVGPNRGSFRVRVDGGEWSVVSLQKDKAGHRKVVWSRRLEAGSHRLEIQGLEGKTPIDAVLFLRQ